MKRITPCVAALLAIPGTLRAQGKRQNIVTAQYTYKIVRVFPHDTSAFTQGLAYRNGFLYEGTGLNGRSSLRKVRLETGDVIKKRDLPANFFGEGITVFGDKIIQLTWRSHKGFVYDLNDFTLKTTFSYSGEGWGLTTDGHLLFLSDGTSTIRVLDPKTFQELRHIEVRDAGELVTELNELEFVEGNCLRMSGTQIASHGFLPKAETCLDGSTCPACSAPCIGEAPRLSLMGLRMTPGGEGCW